MKNLFNPFSDLSANTEKGDVGHLLKDKKLVAASQHELCQIEQAKKLACDE